MVNEIVNDRFQVVPVWNVHGRFIETEGGFLRLDLVQRFDIWEHSTTKLWHVDACISNDLCVKVGKFKSETEARETVISMIEV